MAARFVNVDHDTPLLLPPDIREWVPEGHLVHFLMDAVGELNLSGARVNERGTGDEQYPPGMMLGLLISSYASGVFSSRQIENSTYDSVPVRLLCADTHPDHDTICAFRRQRQALLSSGFSQVLEMAAGCGVLKVGGITVAIDGTQVLANASKQAAVSYPAGRRADAGTGFGDRPVAGQGPKKRMRLLGRTGCPSPRKCSAGRSAKRFWPRRERRWKREPTRGRKPSAVNTKPKSPRGRKSGGLARSRAARSPSRRAKLPVPRTNTTSPIPRAGSCRRAVVGTASRVTTRRRRWKSTVGSSEASGWTMRPTTRSNSCRALERWAVEAGPVKEVLIDSGFVSQEAIEQLEKDAQGEAHRGAGAGSRPARAGMDAP